MAETLPGNQLADAIVLFGATGDLSRRMVLPSLYFLHVDGRLPPDLKILATARATLTRDAFLAQVGKMLHRISLLKPPKLEIAHSHQSPGKREQEVEF